ncbi:MAG: hypothetical protein ACP5RZ_00365 [Thermoplasmata archaeon]
MVHLTKRTKDIIELLSTVGVLALIFFTLYLYTGNWPPMTIIESSSMEHGTNFTWGVINAGDIVLVKRVNSINDIVTYVQGRETGYTSYGDYGNVILYEPYNNTIPIIHRAMMYITWNGLQFHIRGESEALNQGWMKIIGYTVILFNVGFKHRDFGVDLSDFVGENGFITMGDNNLGTYVPGTENVLSNATVYFAADQNWGIAPGPVKLYQIVGIAVGWLPWLGVLKLLIYGDTTYIPVQSYYYFGAVLTIIVVIILFYDDIIRMIRKLFK